MSDIDYTDDWMNPQPTHAWIAPMPEDRLYFAIQRSKRHVCFGTPGSIVRWEEWSRYDTEAERDAALEKLQKEHPAWQLRKHRYNPFMDAKYPWSDG